MELIPIQTGVLREGDDIATVISGKLHIENDDIVVISSKAVATTEGTLIDLAAVKVTQEAHTWAETMATRPFATGDTAFDAAFRQAVLDECTYWNGRVLSDCPNAMLTELRPVGMERGTILIANAGLDRSNTALGCAVGWPRDPVRSASRLRSRLRQARHDMSLAVILSDSCCRPRRIGVTAIALAVSGLDPVQRIVGETDLFGCPLTMTNESTADQLATAANFLMGNAGQGIPAVIIRDHGLTLSDVEGWVPGIEPEEDLFRGANG